MYPTVAVYLSRDPFIPYTQNIALDGAQFEEMTIIVS